MTLNDRLKKWIDKGLLKPEKVSAKDIAKLVRRGSIDIRAARDNLHKNEELAYTAAYLAVLRAGRGLLFAHGFRPSGHAQHKTTFDAIGVILGKDVSDLMFAIDDMRKRRNQFTYDVDFIDSISDEEAESAISDAEQFLKAVCKYLREKWPDEREYSKY